VTRIATFNVNGINGRLPVLLKWLGETSYDVVCLQELKTSDDKFPIEAIRDAGYGAIWHGQKSYNGVAILARGSDPVERRRGLPGDPDDTHSRYLEAEIDGLIIGCIYLPNGNPAPGPRKAYANMLSLGWVDAMRRIHPGKGIYTYWNFSYRGGYDRSSGLRMDHLLVSPPLARSILAAGVDVETRGWEKPSDHAPAWIDLGG